MNLSNILDKLEKKSIFNSFNYLINYVDNTEKKSNRLNTIIECMEDIKTGNRRIEKITAIKNDNSDFINFVNLLLDLQR